MAARSGLSAAPPPAAYHLGVPITSIGPACARRGCSFPLWNDTLDGYRDEREAVELPWEALAGLLADPPSREG